MRFPHFVAALFLFVTVVGVTGCWPVNPGDTSSANIEVEIEADDREDPEDGAIYVSVLFKGPGGPVAFQAGETVTCNGVPLSDSGSRGYAGRVPQVAPGDTYEFGYTRNGISTTISMTALERPVLKSPTSGAAIPRCSSVTVNYLAAGGESIVARAQDRVTQTEGPPQADTGTYSQLDVSRFNAGPGSIELTRIVKGAPPRNGFKNVQTRYHVGSRVDVTWL